MSFLSKLGPKKDSGGGDGGKVQNRDKRKDGFLKTGKASIRTTISEIFTSPPNTPRPSTGASDSAQEPALVQSSESSRLASPGSDINLLNQEKSSWLGLPRLGSRYASSRSQRASCESLVIGPSHPGNQDKSQKSSPISGSLQQASAAALADSIAHNCSTPTEDTSTNINAVNEEETSPLSDKSDSSYDHAYYWQKAYEIAKKEIGVDIPEWGCGQKSLDDTVFKIIEEVKNTKTKLDLNDIKNTLAPSTRIRLAEWLGNLAGTLQKYASAVDIAIQHHSEYTALVWAAFRICLQIFVNHLELNEAIQRVIKDVHIVLARGELYASMVKELHLPSRTHQSAATLSSPFKEHLGQALPELYAQVLIISVKVKKYFESAIGGKLPFTLVAFQDSFGPLLESLKDRETALQNLACIATMQRLKETSESFAAKCKLLEGLNMQLNTVEIALKDVKDDVHRLLTEADKNTVQRFRKWLAPVDSAIIFNDANRKGQVAPQTCSWAINSQQFKNWCNFTGTPKHLVISGKPGAGKTVLSARLLKYVKDNTPQDMIVIYHYFRDGSADQTSAVVMIRSLIDQLVNSGEHQQILFDIIKSRDNGAPNPSQDADDLWCLFSTLITKLCECHTVKVLVLVDALDECTDHIEFTRNLLADESLTLVTHARFLITTRPNTDIQLFDHDHTRNLFSQSNKCQVLEHMPMSSGEDIITWASVAIANDTSGRLKNNETIILEALRDKADGMFRYAELLLNELKRPSTRSIPDILKALPKGLYKMYERILIQLAESEENEHFSDALQMRSRILLLVAMALRPIGVDEVAYACVVPSDGRPFKPEEFNIPTETDILKLCGPLIEVTSTEISSWSRYTYRSIRFSHFSVKEFLSNPETRKGVTNPSVYQCLLQEAEVAHASIALISLQQILALPSCIGKDGNWSTFDIDAYMSTDQFKATLYAMYYWFYHASQVASADPDTKGTLSHKLWALVDDFLNDMDSAHLQILLSDYHLYALRLSSRSGSHLTFIRDRKYPKQVCRNCSKHHVHTKDKGSTTFQAVTHGGFYLACALGMPSTTIQGTLERLEKLNCSSCTRDFSYLGEGAQLAAMGGYHDVIFGLLDHGRRAILAGHSDKFSQRARTAFGEALYYLLNYHEDIDISIFKDLLAWAPDMIDVNHTDRLNNTLLHEAVVKKRMDIMKALLENSADVNLTGGPYGSALGAAACGGHMEAMQLLLNSGADVNLTGGPYGSALCAVAGRSNMEAMQLLLNSGADVNLTGGLYGSALCAAVCRGNMEVMQLLLNSGADVNLTGGEYGSALCAAAYRGHMEAMQLLLNSGADVNLTGGEYGSALGAAAYGSEIEAMKILLQHGAEISLPILPETYPIDGDFSTVGHNRKDLEQPSSIRNSTLALAMFGQGNIKVLPFIVEQGKVDAVHVRWIIDLVLDGGDGSLHSHLNGWNDSFSLKNIEPAVNILVQDFPGIKEKFMVLLEKEPGLRLECRCPDCIEERAENE